MVGKIKDEYSREEIRKSINEKNKEYIYVFSNEIMDKFDDKDLSNFYHNISNLKIIFPNFIGRKFRVSTGGIYYTKSNKLFIPKVYENISANHELFHMISTFKDDKKIFSGFSQTTTSFFSTTSIGDGLTEGYTELMTNRYFKNQRKIRVSEGEYIDVSVSYKCLEMMASRLEEIVGRRTMESLYLNADLLGLINELSKYTNVDDIMKFISDTDFIINYFNEKNYKFLKKKLLIFLLDVYTKKLAIDYDSNFENIDEIKEKINNYLIGMPNEANFNNEAISLMPTEDAINIIKNNLSCFNGNKVKKNNL